MKRLLFVILSLFIFNNLTLAQNTLTVNRYPAIKYDKAPTSYDWTLVDQLQKEGLPRKAVAQIQVLQKRAIAENNVSEYWKTLDRLNQCFYDGMYESEDFEQFYWAYNQEVDQLPVPFSNILHWNLAQSLNDLSLGENEESKQWKMGDKSIAMNNENRQLLIAFHERAALNHTEELMEWSMKSCFYLNSSEDTSSYNNTLKEIPTLFDYLAQSYIDQHQYSYNRWSYNNNESSLSDPLLFSTTDSLPLSKDYTAAKDLTLQLYYHLERLHKETKRYTNYTRCQVDRLNFVTTNYTGSNPEELKTAAFQRLMEELYKLKSEAAIVVSFYLADDLYRSALNYNWKTNTASAKDNLKALAIIQRATTAFPKGEGIETLNRLEKRIKDQSLELSLKNDIIPAQSQLLNLSYRNVPTAVVKVYHIEKQLTVSNQNPLKNLTLKEVYSKTVSLEIGEGYLPHDKDFILPAFPTTGSYLIMVGESEQKIADACSIDSLFKVNGFAYKQDQNTQLYVKSKQNDGKTTLQIVNRLTGKPVVGATVTYYRNVYGFEQAKRLFLEKTTTDKNGMSVSNYTGQYEFTVDYKGDSVSSNLYTYSPYNSESLVTKVQVYTDRSIYRPGQTVHYKAIAYEDNDKKRGVVPNFQVRLEATDMNGQVIGSQTQRTNEYGSVSGSFTLPLSGFMLGSINLRINEGVGYSEIRVEEYKRPTFEVVFDTVKTQYAMGDSVTISGHVKALAGYPIAGSKVVVTIAEQRYFPWNYRGSMSDYNELVLNATSDETGLFSVKFLAEKGDNQILGTSYSMNATATDPTGETQQGDSYLYIGKERLSLSAAFNSTYISSETNTVLIEITNNSGVAQKSQAVSWKIEKQVPGKALLTAINPAEFHDFDRPTFQKSFLEYAYFEEDTKIDYTTVSEGTIQSGTALDLNKLLLQNVGNYRVSLATKDDTGNSIEEVENFAWISPKAKKQHESNFWVYTQPISAKPGSKVTTSIGSSRKSLTVFAEYFSDNQFIKSEWIQLKNKKELKATIPTNAKHQYSIQFSWMINGHLEQESAVIEVENLKERLIVKLATQRDFLRPGAKEEWSVIVTDQSEKAIPAELLVGMYDASLDQFEGHGWNYNLFYPDYVNTSWSIPYAQPYGIEMNRWRSFEYDYYGLDRLEGRMLYDMEESSMGGTYFAKPGVYGNSLASKTYSFSTSKDFSVNYIAPLVSEAEMKDEAEQNKQVQLRSNFNETAFFYPHILPEADGTYRFSFTLPDALTRWRFMSMAHAKDMRMGYDEATFTAKKEIMITPNVPRFYREGDAVLFTAKVSNQTAEEVTTTSRLRFIDPYTEKDVTALFGTITEVKSTVGANGTTDVSWKLVIPEGKLSLVAYAIETTTASFSDGEKRTVPILSNRVQLTESVPFAKVTAGESTFTLDKLGKLNVTDEKISLKLEVQTQPLWTTLMSLPYLMEYPYECAEQTFARYFGNVLAQKIIEDNPDFKRIIEAWKQDDPSAFMAQLDLNPELKAIIMNETPWVMDAQAEKDQRARLAVLFDENTLNTSIEQALAKLKTLKTYDGAWGWFGNESSNVYITQHIVSGFGQLKALGIEVDETMINQALAHLENWYAKQFALLTKEQKKVHSGLSDLTVHWLVARSYFTDKTSEAVTYYRSCLDDSWKNYNLHTQALVGMAALRSGDKVLAEKIRTSMIDKATVKQLMGMYWNENKNGYYWNQSEIETQSIIIEFMDACGKNPKEVQQMQLWLLQNKRANAWETTKATTTACYALLVDKSTIAKQLSQQVTVRMGDGTNLGLLKNNAGTERSWTGSDITPGKATVVITATNDMPVFGAMHLTYLSDQDSVQKSTGDIRVERHFYKKVNNKEVEVLPGEIVEVGTKLIVKITVTGNRSLEFVHIRAPHAFGFEPVNALSGYRWGETSYYEVNKDASTELFIDNLKKGNSTFTYEIFATGKGTLSIGPAIVECLYAPEFRANTGGRSVTVK